MENKKSSSLEQAFQAYIQDCAGRPGFSPEDLRELESDLRERVADLIGAGLTEAEAFGQAVRQIGSPSQLAREFARENPLAVWRERLFWMVWAGFAVLVWDFLTNGTLGWVNRELLLHVPLGRWMTLTGQVPVLIAAVMLAQGRFQALSALLEWWVHSRGRLAVVGAAALVLAGLVRLFGPSGLELPAAGFPMTVLFLSDFFGWPLVLLVLAIVLGGTSRLGMVGKPTSAVVWHTRVLWMALAGLLVGLWESASGFGITTLFYTGNNERPYDVAPLVLMSVDMLILLSPLIIGGLWYRHRLRAGKGFSTGTPHRSRLLLVLPAVVCGWVGLHVWSSYIWMPHNLAFPWRDFWMFYVTSLQWLWPTSLAALVFWLAPQRPETGERMT